jgi:hypothetical protein
MEEAKTEDTKAPLLNDLDSSEEEVKPKKRGKKRFDDDDFNPGFQDDDDDFDIKDAASDHDSLPSDMSDEDIPDALADLPDTPPKRIRKPKGEKKAPAKRSAPKSPSKAKQVAVSAPSPPPMNDDVISLSDSEDLNPKTGHSSDNDDFVLGKSVKQRKSYKPKSSTKPNPAAAGISKISTNPSSSSPTTSKPTPSKIQNPPVVVDNEKKRSRIDDQAPNDSNSDVIVISDSADLPPSPKKPKLEETVSPVEIVLEAPKEPTEAASKSKPGSKAKKTAKATAAPKKASSTTSKAKNTGAAAKKVESDAKTEKSKTSSVAADSTPTSAKSPSEVTEKPASNQMDVDKPAVTVDATLDKTETKAASKTDASAAPIAPKAAHSEAKSATNTSTAAKSVATAKPLASKVTSSVAKSTASSSLSTQKKASTSPVNAPFKLVASSSAPKPSTGIPGQNRPAMRMGLSRASKPLHPPVK